MDFVVIHRKKLHFQVQ